MKKILITGAAGNLGGLLSMYLKDLPVHLNLMVHNKNVDKQLRNHSNVSEIKADLGSKDTLDNALKGVSVVVHFAGVLFKSNPEKFLPVTNTEYFRNLVEKAVEHSVARIILISFPHVEGETFPDKPAVGKLDQIPDSVHAKTRLEEEKLLFRLCGKNGIEPVSLRIGMVYGKGILMIEGARWFAKHGLLGIWKKPTWIHLISTDDFLEAVKNAILKENISGIYHLGDDGRQTLQEFLNDACQYWGYKKPKQLPLKLIMTAAGIFELFSYIFRTRSPLTRDFIKIGCVSYYGDTSRMKKELISVLKYKTYKEGMKTL